MKMSTSILKVYHFINFHVEVIFYILTKSAKLDVEVVGHHVIVLVSLVVSPGGQEVRDYLLNRFDGKFL